MPRKRKTRPRGSGYVYQKPNGWAFRFYDARGRRLQRSGFPTRDLADDELAKLRTALARNEYLGVEEIEPTRFETFAEGFLTRAERRMRASTVRALRPLVEGLVTPAFTGRRLDDISRGDVEAFLSKRSVDGAGAATVNRSLSALSAIFRDAVALGHVREAENPCRGVKRAREDVKPSAFLSAEEQRKLVEKCPERIRPLVVLALETGARQGELLSLAWPFVDFDRKLVTFAKTKSGKPRVVPLTGRALAALNELHAKRGPVPISGSDRVLAAAGIPATWNGRLQTKWQAATDNAGIPRMRFHALRAVFASSAIAAGLSVPELQRLLGHGTALMSLRYAAAVPKDSLDNARERLSAWKDAKPAEAQKAVQ